MAGDGAFVAFDEMFYQEEADAEAGIPFGTGVYLLELVEYPGQVRCIDAAAGVADDDGDLACGGCEPEVDGSTGGCELKGIGQEVEKGDLDLFVVALDLDRILLGGEAVGDIPGGGLLGKALVDLVAECYYL